MSKSSQVCRVQFEGALQGNVGFVVASQFQKGMGAGRMIFGAVGIGGNRPIDGLQSAGIVGLYLEKVSKHATDGWRRTGGVDDPPQNGGCLGEALLPCKIVGSHRGSMRVRRVELVSALSQGRRSGQIVQPIGAQGKLLIGFRVLAVEGRGLEQEVDGAAIVAALVADASRVLREFGIAGLGQAGADREGKGVGHPATLAQDAAGDAKVLRRASRQGSDLCGEARGPRPVAGDHVGVAFDP